MHIIILKHKLLMFLIEPYLFYLVLSFFVSDLLLVTISSLFFNHFSSFLLIMKVLLEHIRNVWQHSGNSVKVVVQSNYNIKSSLWRAVNSNQLGWQWFNRDGNFYEADHDDRSPIDYACCNYMSRYVRFS